jgi:intein/homing endonuclease
MGIKYKVNENFFKAWSPTMAYVLGFIYADGCIYPSVRGSYLSVTSIDEHIIVNIKRWMESDHTITKTIFADNRKPRFGLKIGNKEIYADLLKLGVYPNKSLTVRMPDIPQFVLRHFVRGYFDGDGCIDLYRSKGLTQEIILRKLTTIFTSGSRLFLKDLLEVLKKNLEIKQTKVYGSRRAFQLRFNTSESVQFFKFMYAEVPTEFFFLRKFKIFATYFSLRPQRIDKEVEIILRYIGNGHVVK